MVMCLIVFFGWCTFVLSDVVFKLIGTNNPPHSLLDTFLCDGGRSCQPIHALSSFVPSVVASPLFPPNLIHNNGSEFTCHEFRIKQ